MALVPHKRKRPDLSIRNTIHGLSKGPDGKKTRLYNIWIRMKQRCFDTNSSDYNRYGGRGITVCPEWNEKYATFYEWATENGYLDNLTIERKNNNGNYEPGNCLWILPKDQAKNRRNNHLISFRGETKILMDWSRQSGIDQALLRYRIKHWGIERAFTTTVRSQNENHT